MSRRPGAVTCVANPEHPFENLAHRRQWIELAPLHLVEQPPQLRIVRDRVLEMLLRARGRDREHLTGQILAPPLLECAGLLEMGAMLLDLRTQLGHVLAEHGFGEYDRR